MIRRTNSQVILDSSTMGIADQIERKAIVSGILKIGPRPPKRKRTAITEADVRLAVETVLQDVARELRFKAKQTPGWAAAYHSACAEIEKKLSILKGKP